MQCQSCKSERILGLSAKCSDCCSFSYVDVTGNGYVPADLNIGGGDYVEFKYCLECGQIQDQFPISQEVVESALEEFKIQ